MQDTVFREYDIRGVVNGELAIEQVYDLARALAFYFVKQNPKMKTVAVGMDGRLHSAAIKKQLCRGFLDSGLDVIFIGVCTSPALYFALHANLYGKSVDAGVMITASHNPKEYNGLKICLGTQSVWGKEIAVIRDLFKAGAHIDLAKSKNNKRGAYKEESIIEPYVSWLVDNFKHLKDMKLSALIDCGNGAAGTVLPQLIQKFNWPNVKLLFAEVDGNYPNHEADPTVSENMADLKKELAKGDFDLGIGLDGDCDRMAPMTKDGFLVPGDQLLAVFAKQLIEKHPGMVVVFDVKASSGLIDLLKQLGVRPYMSKTGHALVKMNMKREGALLGGELSCHFVFSDRYFGYDDGIYAMVRLFEILMRTGKSLRELLAIFPDKVSSPEIRMTCKEEDKSKIVQAVKLFFSDRSDAECITIDGVRAHLPYGWGIVRASNTQPKISMRLEADTQENLQRVKEDFYVALQPYFDDHSLREQLGLE